jgi:hypothetical protein
MLFLKVAEVVQRQVRQKRQNLEPLDYLTVRFDLFSGRIVFQSNTVKAFLKLAKLLIGHAVRPVSGCNVLPSCEGQRPWLLGSLQSAAKPLSRCRPWHARFGRRQALASHLARMPFACRLPFAGRGKRPVRHAHLVCAGRLAWVAVVRMKTPAGKAQQCRRAIFPRGAVPA